jgi:hypothetical protein
LNPHIAVVSHVLTSGTVQAECTCGWKGEERPTNEADKAQDEATQHERDAA